MNIYNKFLRAFKLLNAAYGNYRFQIGVIAVLSIFGGFFGGIGINAIIPLFSFIDVNQPAGTDIFSKLINLVFNYAGIEFTITNLLLFIIGLFVAKALASFLSQYINIKIIADYETKTRADLLKKTLESDWSYLSQNRFGYLDQLLITDVTNASGLLSRISALILIAVNLIIYSLLVINISFWVAILALFFGGLAFLIFWPWFYKSRQIAAVTADEYKGLAHYINENILGLKVIKSMFVENRIFQKGLDSFYRLKSFNIKAALLQQFISIFLEPVGIIFIIIIFLFSYKTSTFSFAAFAVVVYAINRIFGNIKQIQTEAHSINTRLPYLLAIRNYEMKACKNVEKDMGTKKFIFTNSLALHNVNFVYNNSQPVLTDINILINRGEIIGLIGPSGVGKTTIVDLLLRLFKPTRGKILLDGEDVSEISLKEWRTNVGYVSQDIFLINDSILNNIKFYNEAISQEDIIEAAKMANIYEFIQSLPYQFETVVGERGVRLSGGQRQRIALARVLARNPEILILDEATSALDNESEAAIQKAIESLKGKVTVIAIAHRLSTILDFDKVLVLDSGKIIEQGAPRELLKDASSQFYKVYNLKH